MVTARLKWPLIAVSTLALALLFMLLRSPSAGAHAVLERSLPVQNQELQEPPAIVETWYSEPLEQSLTKLRVLDSSSNDIAVGPTKFSDDPKYAAIDLPADLGPGIYTVAFQNVSQVDGHQWAGTFSFIVLNADGSRPTGGPVEVAGFSGGGQGYLPGIGDTTLRWLGLLAAAALFGAASFYLFVARPAAGFLEDDEQERVQDASMALAGDIAVMAAPVMIISILGQVFLLADRLGGLDNLDNILFDTRTGQLWLARLGLSLALGLLFAPALTGKAFRTGPQAGLIVTLALIGTAGLLMTYSLGSHADAAPGGQFWSVGSDFVHFAATGAWIGALLQLPLVFWWSRGRLDDGKRLLYMANVLDRFSWLAAVSVVLLIGTGVFNGFVQLPTLESFWETTYGRVLIVKLLLIVPMLGVAGINALFLKPALVEAIDALHGDEPSRGPASERFTRRLARVQRTLPWTTAAEFALGAVVLASVAILAQSTTADGELRQDAGKPSGERSLEASSDTLRMNLLIEPFGLGLNNYAVTLTPQEGEQLGEVLSVDLVASFNDPNAPPSAGRSGTRQPLEATDQPGVWSADAALLTQPGDWSIQILVRRRGVDDEQAVVGVRDVGGYLATTGQPEGLFDLPFTFVGWNIAAGGAMVAMGLGAFLIWRNRPSGWQRSTANSIGAASLFGLVAGAILLFGIHVHRPVDNSAPSPVPPTRESLALGQQLFENNCQVCHGPAGEGDGPAASGLDVQPPRYVDHIPYHSDRTLYVWITNGIESNGVLNMPAWGDKLSDTERWTLVTWLRQTFGTGQFKPVLPQDLQGG